MDKHDYKLIIERLRSKIDRYESRFALIEPGYYLALDDGSMEGGWNDAGEAHKQAERCASHGFNCTIIRVGKRFLAEKSEG